MLCFRPSKALLHSLQVTLPCASISNQECSLITRVCRLMGQVVAVLGASSCTGPARDAGLGIVESLLDYGDAAALAVLQPHMGGLLEALRTIAQAGTAAPAAGKRSKPPAKARPVNGSPEELAL